jgi:hypothetical protein
MQQTLRLSLSHHQTSQMEVRLPTPRYHYLMLEILGLTALAFRLI